MRRGAPPPPPAYPPDYDPAAEEPPPPPDCLRRFEISGSVASRPKGIQLSGSARSLEELFQLKTKGDLVGTLRFRPEGETGGTWTYQGKVSNAPFKATGAGTYTLGLSDDRASGVLDLGFVVTIKIPRVAGRKVVADQTGGGSASLSLAAGRPRID